jgi:hypothetical protein
VVIIALLALWRKAPGIENSMKVTKRQVKEIQVLKRLRDEEIDLTDIPPLTNWNKAVIGKFYRPIKKSLTTLPRLQRLSF